jgi:predicted SAM-dependent methyltransferase
MRRMDELRNAVGNVVAAVRHVVRGAIDGPRLRSRARRVRGPVRLSIGSGSKVPDGWLGLDFRERGPAVYSADLRRPLPLPDACVDAILAEHILEHMFLDDGIRLLDECHRVLRPGGVIRVVSPDAELIGRMLLEPDHPDVQEEIAFDCELHRRAARPDLHWIVANRLSHQWGSHQALLTAGLVQVLLGRAGFVDVCRCRPAQSVAFAEAPDTHLACFGAPIQEAFAIEARKSGEPHLVAVSGTRPQ